MTSEHQDAIAKRAEAIQVREMARMAARTTGSSDLFDRAVKTMPGGVASSFQLSAPYPIYL